MVHQPQRVQSPCIRNCCLDEKDICLGCFRSIEEILQWGEATDQCRLSILDNVEQRKKQREK